jgi:RimJ/RimL family protein N-acetyltransferase
MAHNNNELPPMLIDISTDRIMLKEVSWDDLNHIHHHHLNPDVDRYNTLGIPENIEITKDRLKLMIEAQKKFPRATYTWKILLKNPSQFMGMAGMSLSNDRFKLAEIYYGFLPEYWGKGYATEVAKALIKTGFEKFNLHKIEAGVAIDNHQSIKVLEKSGMTREGLRRKILPIRGEWKDNYHYGIVEDDPRDF